MHLLYETKYLTENSPANLSGAEALSWGASQINPIDSQSDNFEGITVKAYQYPILDSKTYKMSFTSVCKASVPFLLLRIDVCENAKANAKAVSRPYWTVIVCFFFRILIDNELEWIPDKWFDLPNLKYM